MCIRDRCTVLQLAGQVQIGDQRAEFFALYADVPGFLARLVRQGGILLQLFGPAQNQGERRADIMAHACDPPGSRLIPPGNDFALLLQVRAGLVQLFG